MNHRRLMDCIGMGKPVTMTNNFHINIEKEKIGLWVNPGDVDRWKEKLLWFQNNPDEPMETGIRAKKLALGVYSSRNFLENIIKIFDQVLVKNNN
jgi:glycosyltransferase involved in cell wall biosynthesis